MARAAEGVAGRSGRDQARSIVIDARAIRASGIGRFLREVLSRLMTDERFGRIKLLGNREELGEFLTPEHGAGKVELHDYPGGFYSPATQLAWLRLRASGVASADVAFFPHFDAPVVGLPRRSVVTIQDLIHFKVPEAFPASKRLLASVVLRRVVTGAGSVLVTSLSTRGDLLERVPGCASRLEVIPLGVDAEQWAPNGARPESDRPYLLCVGNRKPHKNLVAAVETLARLIPDRPELRLVIVGKEFRGGGMREQAERLQVAHAIEECADVSDVQLRDLYQGCEALLFPSYYEGFGLPVLEAMAAGAPVVSSNRSSLPEVVGDAGILVDPDDHDAIALAVRRLWNEPGLREALLLRGQARVRELTWAETAARTADSLHRVASGGAEGRA
jgi:glycosyltransferase involved in cell wall biosynthesis